MLLNENIPHDIPSCSKYLYLQSFELFFPTFHHFTVAERGCGRFIQKILQDEFQTYGTTTIIDTI